MKRETEFTVEYFMGEIDRAYSVLGLDKGECQNSIDIDAWFAQGLINSDERRELRAYSAEVYDDMYSARYASLYD